MCDSPMRQERNPQNAGNADEKRSPTYPRLDWDLPKSVETRIRAYLRRVRGVSIAEDVPKHTPESESDGDTPSQE